MQLPEMETHTKGVGAGRVERRQPEHTTNMKLCHTVISTYTSYHYIAPIQKCGINRLSHIGYNLKSIIDKSRRYVASVGIVACMLLCQRVARYNVPGWSGPVEATIVSGIAVAVMR
jgi:hypothetical protein